MIRHTARDANHSRDISDVFRRRNSDPRSVIRPIVGSDSNKRVTWVESITDFSEQEPRTDHIVGDESDHIRWLILILLCICNEAMFAVV
jgi:hypothetical protein